MDMPIGVAKRDTQAWAACAVGWKRRCISGRRLRLGDGSAWSQSCADASNEV